ncbi:xylulokinase [Hoeflea prorocentri]|uniref:Xylulose kinase n=1 Tax=Hoeflea prorocentri TaxID=1922333 RepID=A0A9X3UFJ3_9HYPH|nr:xylulokinase [Hoeflea prorocentri]MCY6379781.1 xylulokinase [Hoeflea prorocentri]MDA5397581.1 xylulokinase [Hoeflea prorocentri]
MTAAFLGIDIGTSSCKALLLSADGTVIGTQTSPYGFDQPREGWAEQDPHLWRDGAARAVKALLSEHDVELACVGLSGQMHGMTALDAGDEVIRPAILWNDQRNAVECAEITDLAGGLDGLISMTGNQMLPGFTGGKIRWFLKHEPQAFERTRIILNPKDYIRLLMTGERMTEVTDASGTGLFDVANRRWSDELFDCIGLDRQLLPPALESAEIAGKVTSQGAQIFGIPVGTPVIGGGGDAVIQTLGSGVAAPGRLQTTIGTAGIVAAALNAPLANTGGRVQISCNVLPDKWHCMGVSLNAGSALEWWRGLHGSDDRSPPHFDELSEAAQQVDLGSGGMLFLPYLMGERCPWPDPDARGAFVGVRSHHSLAHMHRAVFEGIVFSLRDMAGLIDPERAPEGLLIHTSGGGSLSPFWNQMQADIFGAPVVTTSNSSHGGAFGAAILAGIGKGHWQGVDDIETICKEVNRWSPMASAHVRYNEYFAHYQTLHEALLAVSYGLSELQGVEAM